MRWTNPAGPGLLIAMLCLLSGCNTGAAVRRSTAYWPPDRGFLTRTVNIDGQTRKFAVFIPKDYSPERRYPTIVFLHGLFEAGSDATRNLGAGLGPIIAKNPEKWPFIVVFPHSRWNWKGDAADRLVMACLDDVQSNYSVDPDRVILAGLSVGGRGAWNIGARHRDRFAALVPAAAGTSFDDCVRLAGTPIWCFHYSGDPFMAAGGSRRMCERIAQAGGSVRYTQFSAIGHDCWERAAAETDVVNWMLQQRRSNSEAQASVPVEP